MVHTSLVERIAEHALLISELPPRVEPHHHPVPDPQPCHRRAHQGHGHGGGQRAQRCPADLGRAVLLGRSAMAVPGPVTSAMSVGCHEAIRFGARLVTSCQEVLEEVGLVGDDLAPPVRGPERTEDRLGPVLSRILDAVPRRGGLDAGQLAASAGLPLREALRAPPTLKELGQVLAKEDGRYVLAPPPKPAGPAPEVHDPGAGGDSDGSAGSDGSGGGDSGGGRAPGAAP
jgi:DNA processing protein